MGGLEPVTALALLSIAIAGFGVVVFLAGMAVCMLSKKKP